MNITSSFYDALNKLVIGFLILLPVVSFSDCLSSDTILFVIACWMIGIFIWAVSESLMQPFSQSLPFMKKNNLEWINQEYDSVTKEVGRKYIDPVTSMPLYKLELRDYYSIYYKVQKNGLLGSVPVLESYSAFFLNLSFVFIWWTIVFCIVLWRNDFTPASIPFIPIYVIPILLFSIRLYPILLLSIILSLYFRKCVEHKIFSSIFYAYFLYP